MIVGEENVAIVSLNISQEGKGLVKSTVQEGFSKLLQGLLSDGEKCKLGPVVLGTDGKSARGDPETDRELLINYGDLSILLGMSSQNNLEEKLQGFLDGEYVNKCDMKTLMYLGEPGEKIEAKHILQHSGESTPSDIISSAPNSFAETESMQLTDDVAVLDTVSDSKVVALKGQSLKSNPKVSVLEGQLLKEEEIDLSIIKSVTTNEKDSDLEASLDTDNKNSNIDNKITDLRDKTAVTIERSSNNGARDKINFSSHTVEKEKLTAHKDIDRHDELIRDQVPVPKSNELKQKEDLIFDDEVAYNGKEIENVDKDVNNNILSDDISQSTSNDKTLEKLCDSIIKLMETSREGKTDIMKVKLHPEELGTVDIVLTMEDGKITAKIVVDNEYLKQMFDSKVNDLNNSLLKQNINLEKLQVDLGSSGRQSNNQNFEGNNYLRKRRMIFSDVKELPEDNQAKLSTRGVSILA